MTRGRLEAFSAGVVATRITIRVRERKVPHVVAVPLAFHWFADAIDILVALPWLVPDRRIESRLREAHASR